MGFKSSKKSKKQLDDYSPRKSLFDPIKDRFQGFVELFGQSLQTRTYLQLAFLSFLFSLFILVFLILTIPRTIEQSRGIGELKYLNQELIIKNKQFELDPSDQSLQLLNHAQQTFAKELDSLNQIHAQDDELNQVNQLWSTVSSNVTQPKLLELRSAINNLETTSTWLFVLISALLVIGLICFTLCIVKLFILRGKDDRQRLLALVEKDKRNQNAIFRLLDEISDLADGDLRKYAAVSEDFTGAIADSINYAIDQLRDLVSRINQASEQVARYTQKTENISHELAQSSEVQAQEINDASAAIREIADSIDHVSANAQQSSEVALRSVEIASKGGQVVNRSIEGMDTIRAQIQETSKRIKRLGESTQEIGNFVALIHDIADQTNILALNATIQASMAGEAGRGFAVVADEVQRLAGRSTSATKQIEALVKNIQIDTNEAVSSMEHTTSEVVRGADLAKDAGSALEDIQNVSNQLEKLIANISTTAKLQSTAAGQIANTMNVVDEITRKNHESTLDTAQSVAELAQMATSLRASVSNFKLPE